MLDPKLHQSHIRRHVFTVQNSQTPPTRMRPGVELYLGNDKPNEMVTTWSDIILGCYPVTQEELPFYSTYPEYFHAEYPYSHLLFPKSKPKDLSMDQDRRSQTGRRKTWFRARDGCKTVGADLLINHSKEKEKLIYEGKRSYDNFEFWIGLNDRSHEGDFNWLDKKEKITGVPWKDNKTGRYNKGKNCVVIVRKRNQDAHFLDQPCFLKAFYMCEFYTTCANQTYGANCSKKCSTNCRGPNSDCEDVNGFCIFGCDDGYQGVKCKQACDSNKFGANCSKTCSERCGGPKKTCNNVNGFCTSGCIDGYQGQRCQDPCDSKKFGANCSKRCSERCGGPNKACNNVNGFCTSGCIDGYQGQRFRGPQSTPESKNYSKTIIFVSSLLLSACLVCAAFFLHLEENDEFWKPKTKQQEPVRKSKIDPA
ncbi:hypothetical protein RRG08_007584 [Elysia crispata]|uniref:C-type lectin domain-containing protein n=1 Tax=Elysia crispata TaxID=231223 RepID=A0AAE1BB93_9GAST|nr:hypothetical protein RRG08_007584 [Elysia crispata]